MSTPRRDKPFLLFLALSLLIHVGGGLLISLVSSRREQVTPPSSYEVDLSGLDLPSQPAVDQKPARRLDERRRRVDSERSPKGVDGVDTSPRTPPPPARGGVPSTAPPPMTPEATPKRPNGEPLRGEGLFRPQGETTPSSPTPRLMPGAERLARLEELYRRKYREDVTEGEAHFVNTDDIKFGSFLRRFENAVYGVWRYPQEAVRLGIEGVVPTRITFDRKGEIVKVQILESSGSRLLDDEVLRTLRSVGVIGGFPRSYDREEFVLIAFFHYGIRRGEFRSIR